MQNVDVVGIVVSRAKIGLALQNLIKKYASITKHSLANVRFPPQDIIMSDHFIREYTARIVLAIFARSYDVQHSSVTGVIFAMRFATVETNDAI